MLHVYVMEQTHLFPFDFCNFMYGLVAHINCLLGQSSKYFSGLKFILHKSTGVFIDGSFRLLSLHLYSRRDGLFVISKKLSSRID